MAGGVQLSPPFLQVVPIGLVVLMVVQPFLEPVVQILGAEVPGFFQLAQSPVLYLRSVVLLGAQALVFRGVQVLGVRVYLGEQTRVVLVFRGVLPLTVQGVLEAQALWGDLEVPLFLEFADLWLDLDLVLKIPGVPEVLEAGQTLCLRFIFLDF
jgi:hypothetical protein